MEFSIFTEGSKTVNPEIKKSFKSYFQGQFLPIKKLGDDLETHGEVNYHILSNKWGCVNGNEPVEESRDQLQNPASDFKEALLNAVITSEVIIVALKKSNFETYVVANWERIAREVTSNQILCLCAASGPLENLDLDLLPARTNVITYERRGVARINQETQDDIIKIIEQQIE